MAGNVLVDYAVEHALTIEQTGYCLHSSFYWSPGDVKDPKDLFDPRSYGDIKLKLTGGAAGAPVTVLTQQLRM